MNKLKPHFLYPPKPPPHSASTASTKSFNSTINRLSSEGAHEEVLLTYASMLKANTPPDAYTFPSLLKACTSLNLFSRGLCFHQHVIVYGYSPDAYIGSSLINFYAKFWYTRNARQVFDIMPERNVVPWTAIIGCYSRSGDVKTAVWMYNQMRDEGIQPSSVTILGLLSGVLEITHVQCVHACTFRYGFGSDLALVNSMLNGYGKCGRVEDARDLFELMERRDIVSWNSLVSCYAQFGNIGEILNLLSRMRIEGVDPDKQTFGSLVSATAKQSDHDLGQLVHARILTAGFEIDAHVETSLIVMYLKCGNFDNAFQIFERTPDKDVILWTAMISGLVQSECADKAVTLFRCMLLSNILPSTATIASALAACAQLGSLAFGTSIHAYMLRQRMPTDITAENSLVTMYAKCNRLEQSRAVFDTMEKRDVVSWNAIVAGYAQNGNLCKSLYLFNIMRTTLQRPDSITVVSLLQACASIGALHQGKWVHTFVIRSCLGPCILIETALVDMYSKCGDLVSARECFDRMSHYDLVSWSTIISGYGSHGKGEIALEMYNKFLLTGHVPNHVILLSVLSACSHNGLLNRGLDVFYSMRNEFRVEPKLEHLACVVDLLSRAGRVEDAYNFYKRRFSEPAVEVLGILLDACRTRGNLELGDIIAREIFMLKPTDAGNYLQLAHNYASTDRYDGVSEAWIQMRSLGLKKLPGWSFIELNGSITTFFTHHSSHPQNEDIVHVLQFLSKEIRDLGVNFKTDFLNIP
ncbi:pentatricopeptide repeat-containing protein At4g04370-like [Actinidia eriantha]|uniref:pentatricopeptide repeat-containing protein At4g04370-like n=1 Tax=Actinidia eriantha TaxID=165200 RepID=UPI00258DCFF0|nr:pentatricopeptide repeat-containing protein At4g04370-like [Actinidia eriantha]XP_057498861.1 pentatricopeptide repeat-containing protein At4g04370-like [Actinidia eriantha]